MVKMDFFIGKNILEKHLKYKDSYKKNALYWGLGIENEFYFQFNDEISFSKEKFINNHSPERYSVNYFAIYKEDIFNDLLAKFDINKLPKTKTLFNKVKYNAGYQSNIFKNYFMKKRPYQEDNSIQVCVPPQPSSLNRSYPSGHTTMGFAMAVILANLIPEKSNEIMARAKLYGINRVYCGAHFPSDVTAGEVLGTLVGIELLKNSEFSSLLKLSKDELIIHHSKLSRNFRSHWIVFHV